MPITIYGIKNCDTMKKARAFLDKKGVAYEFHDYKTQGIDRAKLEGWAKKAGWEKVAQPRRHDIQEIARQGQGRTHRAEGDRADAGAALDDQASGARPGGGKIMVGFKPNEYAALK